jgi:hypothetical protein
MRKSELKEKHDFQVTSWSQNGKFLEGNENKNSRKYSRDIGEKEISREREDLELRQW